MGTEPAVTGARFDAGPVLELTGTGTRPRVDLVGPRARVVGRVSGRGGAWRAVIPLKSSRWGGEELALPSGRYQLTVTFPGEREHYLADEIPLAQLGPLRAALRGGVVDIGPPVDPAYDSGEGQDALERRYASTQPTLENAVFFESFYGRNASCNPLAIDRELAKTVPSVTRYWSVVDLSVAVPPGAVAVVEGSPEWWRARGASRLLVVNDWLRRRYARRRGQVVLQTWHGTPLKRLALDRGFAPRRMLAVLRESRRWNILLAQNSYAARILRGAYAFGKRPLWVEGYPRNDVLVHGDAAQVRRGLGVSDHDRVLLYAPTWRDDREELVDFLDPARLAAATSAVVLVRGHSRTLLPGTDVVDAIATQPGEPPAGRVIDVTSYPDVSELLLAADALVTDYSSVMFDFTVTGKPIYFFVPDLDHYRGELRGFYFDLTDEAPGPIVATQEDLHAALADTTIPGRYAQKYERWRSLFNARDDGTASARVVARILDQGLLER